MSYVFRFKLWRVTSRPAMLWAVELGRENRVWEGQRARVSFRLIDDGGTRMRGKAQD